MSLVLENLRIRQGDFRLELNVELGAHVTGLFGPSGAGKTTLLDAIAGLHRPEAGTIRLGDRVLTDCAASAFVPVHQRRIGYVPQDLALFPHLSVRRNLLFGQRAGEQVDARFSLEAVTELLEIRPLIDRSVAALSGGEKQRVALARALLSAPDLLLLDEPLASLDARLKQRILPFLRRIRDAFPLPILHVSHDPAEVRALCDEVLVLDAGRVVRRGAPEKTLADDLSDAPAS
jgi:molybdate transport system ATP-binding protein